MNRDASSVVSYATSLTVSVFGMTVNELAVVCGTVLAVATFAVNWYYKHKALTLAIQKGTDHGSSHCVD